MRELHRESLSDTLDNMQTPQKPFTDEEKARVINRTFQKAQQAGLIQSIPTAIPSSDPKGDDVHEHQAKKKPRHMAKRTGALLVAAAILCAVSVTAVAAGPTLLKMIKGNIGFFDNAPAQSDVKNPVDALHGDYTGAAGSMKAYNAAIGQKAESNGVTITLDTVSMDAATMNAFFTITGDKAVKGARNLDDYTPEWSQLWGAAPSFWDPSINGETSARCSGMDIYRVDDNTLKLWKHYDLTAAPEGDTVNVVLKETRALGVEGDWSFNVHLDGASIRAGSRQVQPGTFETATDPLRLESLTLGPVGGVIAANIGDSSTWTADGTEKIQNAGMNPSMLYLTDDTGKVLYETIDPTLGHSSIGTQTYSLSTADPKAKSITITPIAHDSSETKPLEKHTISTEELKNGAKIETSPLGGYTVRDYKIAGGVITFQLVPHGWVSPNTTNLIPEDDSVITYAKDTVTEPNGEERTGYHSGLLSTIADPQTGVITVRHDYYAATDEELNQITAWRYYYNPGYSLDAAHAVTLPLENLS